MSKSVEIKYDNAINYKADPDNDIYVSDKQPHLKLRIFPNSKKGSSQGKKFYYDYYWNGKRKRHLIGELSKDNKSGVTPSKARDIVISYEALRKAQPPKHPLQGQQKELKGITLNKHFDTRFVIDGDIKPVEMKDGTRQGMLPKVFKQQVGRYNRHIRNSIGDTPLTNLTVIEIKDWFNSIRGNAPTEALKTLNLAKHIVSHLMKEDETIANVMPNRFALVDQKKLKATLDNKRELNKSPLDIDEFKALWNASDKWYNEVEGLFIKFVMASCLRGISVARLKLKDIIKKKGKYQITVLAKKNIITIRFNETLEQIYKDTLKARKQYPEPQEGYLFPKYVYTQEKGRVSTKRFVSDVANEPMGNDNIDRIFKGRKTRIEKGKIVPSKSGGIRGIASNTEPSILQYSLHDIRDTYASLCNTAEEVADLLGHTIGTTGEKYYRKKDTPHFDKVADLRETLTLRLVS
jgi:integrase